MTIVLLSDLIPAPTATDVLNLELSVATSLGLPTTAWQPLDVDRSTLAINAQIASQQAAIVGLIAQGGYASYAAQMVDNNGNPITTWMDLVANDVFNVQRIPAVAGTGNVPVTTGPVTLTWAPNSPLHFQNTLTGATYTSTGSGTIGSSSSGSVPVVADVAGVVGTVGVGAVLTMLTPVAGVTILPLTASIVGADAENNAHLLSRCQAKLGTLSPNGAASAYQFVAQSIPVGPVSAVFPYFVSSAITRTATITTPGSGVVNVYVANAAGAAPSGDVAVVNSAIQAQVVPASVSATVAAATQANISITGTVYYPASSGFTPATLSAFVDEVVVLYFAVVPVGGLKLGNGSFGIPWSEMMQLILNSSPIASSMEGIYLNGAFNTDVVMSPSDVPVIASGGFNLTFVAI